MGYFSRISQKYFQKFSNLHFFYEKEINFKMKYIIELESEEEYEYFECNYDGNNCKTSKCPFYMRTGDSLTEGCNLYDNERMKIKSAE